MPTPGISTTVSSRDDFGSDSEYIQYLAGVIARAIQEFNYILSGNLDVANIKAKSVTADRMSVKQLSAISADLGTITAGIVIGALIKTAVAGQRVELSSTENLLKAINAAGAMLSIKPSIGGTPGIQFENGSNGAKQFLLSSVFSINTVEYPTSITVASGKGILLNPASGYTVSVPNWSALSTGTGRTLQQEIDDIYAAIAAATYVPPSGP